jgi:hypothetical protein
VKNSFFLVIPEQKNDPERELVFEESTLTQWIAEFPTANPSLSTRLFHDLIIEMNGLIMPVQKRLEALELLRHNFLVIEDYLRSRLIKSGFPKGINEQKIMEVLVSLEKQFTIGYWMSVRELTRRDVGWFQGKNVTLALQRTIRGLSGIVVTYFMMNTPVPDWIWIDLHSLYKLAVKVKKEAANVSDEASLFGKTSAKECYKQILLLSLTDPSCLMQKEFQLIYNFIEKIINQVHIENKPVAELKTQCLILMDEDSAPYFDTSGKATDSAMMFLNLSQLYKACKQTAKFSSENEPRFSPIDLQNRKSKKLSAELFEYLIQRWHGQSIQGAALFGDRLDRYVAIGLEATHSLQSNIAEEGEFPSEIMAETNSDKALACVLDNPGVLSVGSLISCRKTDASKQTRLLGIVTKMTLPKQDNKLVFELKAIAAQSFSVTYLDIDAPSNSGPQKALLYAIKDDEGEKSFIIMDSFMFKDGDILRLFLNQEDFPIILNDRKNIGLGYWQFECRRIAEKVTTTNEKKKGYDFI